jgi:high-affinity iron transporter
MWLVVLLAAAPPEAARAYSLLSYVAGDYAAAVGASGEVISAQELDEQQIFAGDAAQDLRAAGAPDLASLAEQLGARIGDKAAPREVVPMAHALSERIAQRFQLAMLPRRPPDLRRGRALYRQACAACHGAEGTPRVEHLELPTRPTAFSSRQEVARLSPQRIFAAVSFGVPGTAMPSFSGAIDENTMWDVAFAALLFAHPREEQVRGEEVARKLPRRPDWLQLAVRTDEQLRATLSHGPFPPQEREALISAIRSRWIDPPQPAAARAP